MRGREGYRCKVAVAAAAMVREGRLALQEEGRNNQNESGLGYYLFSR